MKRKYTGNIVMLVLLLFTAMACKQKTTVQVHEHQYTCPMHPQIVRDEPGQCPICGMDLVPMMSGNELALDSVLLPLLKQSNAQIAANLPTIMAESGTRIFSIPVQGVVSYDARKQSSISSRVSGRIEKLYIKYNFQPVKKGQLLMEIYSPDLAAAQRELIYISRNDNNASLLQRAKQRLNLLGMQPSQIEQVLRSGKPMYSVPVYSSVSGYIVDQTSLSPAPGTLTPMASSTTSSGGGSGMDAMNIQTPPTPVNTQPQINNAPVMVREGQYLSAGQTVFNIYEANSLVADFYFDPLLAPHIKRGHRLTYQVSSEPGEVYAAAINLLEPIQRSGSNFTTARVYIKNQNLQPGQLLNGRIPVVARGWWLPESAVVGTGNNSLVYKKENGVFVPRNIPTGIRTNGLVQAMDSVGNWEIAKNASYLVGSESFIRTADNE
ncbi:MAG: efflux RND transporter periplasmic adaptor subunit [Bacteroidota bacterium]|nr:efflux RND transporter periplasmic adaptor subunit [Bacteroidota bacterium]